jgi:tripartite-type tricarboxylate transporter receptor subunit TctC
MMRSPLDVSPQSPRAARHTGWGARRLYGLLAGALLALPLLARADYPERPIHVIVAFPAGSAVDLVARSVAGRLTSLGQPVVIENKVGASGNIGHELAARAPKDGYTLLFTATQLVGNPGLGKVNYDPVRDFAPVSLTSRIPALLVVPTDSPAKTVADLIAMAKNKPGTLSYASGGNGGIGHFSGELLKANGGNLDIVHVPYKSAAEQVMSVMTSQTAFAYPAMMLALPHVKAGKLRALAVTGNNRNELLPSVPTMKEAMTPGFVLEAWYGLLAPAGVPAEIVNKLNAEIVKILRDPAVRGALVEGSHEVVASSPAEFASAIRQDLRVWGDLAQKLNVKVD